MHVDDAGRNAFGRELLRSPHRLMDKVTVCEEYHIAAVAYQTVFTEYKRSVLIRYDRDRFAAEADKARPGVVIQGKRRLAGLDCVAGDDNRHTRQSAHQRHVLKRLMCGTIRPDRDAAMRPRELNVQVVIADGVADLIPGAARKEHAVG